MGAALLARAGFQPPGTSDFEWPCIGSRFHVFGFSACVNKEVILIFLVAAIVLALFLVAFRDPQIVPKGMQNVMEAGVDFVRKEIAVQVIGPQGNAYLPLLCSIFFFVFVGNIMGIIPGIQVPPHSRSGVTWTLAIVSWVAFNAVGIKEQGAGRYFKNILVPPGVPKAMLILVTPIELVSTFLVRPATLSIRLLANMIAGHLILTIFFLGTGYLLQPSITALFALASFAMGTVLVAFEIFVAILQAYIFTILTAVYLAGAVSPEH